MVGDVKPTHFARKAKLGKCTHCSIFFISYGRVLANSPFLVKRKVREEVSPLVLHSLSGHYAPIPTADIKSTNQPCLLNNKWVKETRAFVK
jgi:hypothetical protein